MQAYEAWFDGYASTRIVTIGAKSLSAAYEIARRHVREGEVIRGVNGTGEVAEDVATTEEVVYA